MTDVPKNQTPARTGSTTAATAPAVASVATPAATPKPVNAGPSAFNSPAAFGGHRGGGKKRKDGLVAGSPEAIKADKEKDAARKRAERAQTKTANLPPPLPSVSSPAIDPVPAMVDRQPSLPGAVAVPVAIATPAFVPWTQRLLEKPAKLLTKIVDRFRSWQLMQKVRKLGLTREQEKEIEADLKWKDSVVEDFSVALSNCVSIEFNRRHVPGAEHSHWIDVVMTGGEMMLVHMNTLDRLEKMVAANAAKNSGGSEPQKPKTATDKKI